MSKVLKKSFIIILVFIILINSIAFGVNFKEPLKADAAVLMDLTTGEILYSKNPNKLLHPASLTKVMTAILVIENLNLEDEVVIDAKSPFVDGNRVYMTPGEKFSVEELLGTLLVKSANDSALALARYHSGSVDKFVDVMNAKAKEIGMENTVFKNPHGLDHDEHLTTASDLAKLSHYAMKNPKFREIVKMKKFSVPPTNKMNEIRVYENGNFFLNGVGKSHQINYKGKTIDIKYDLVNGIKTGYTDRAGHCLIASANFKDKEVVAVVLNTDFTNLYREARKLIDLGLFDITSEVLINAGDLVTQYELGDERNRKVGLIAKDTVKSYKIQGETLIDVDQQLVMKDDITLPIAKGDTLATLEYVNDGNVIGKTELVAADSVSDKQMLTEKTTFFNKKSKSTPLNRFGWIVFKIFLVFIVWRSIMTFINKTKKSIKNRLGDKN